jgi:hypothetical protein
MRFFTKSLTIDEAADALFLIMRKDFNKDWISKLSEVTGLDIRRAEAELIFLDFFAFYFSLKFTHSSSWRDKGYNVFEKLFSIVASWLGDSWAGQNAGTRDDAFKVLDERLKAYGCAIKDQSSVDPNEMVRSIGLTFATFAFLDDQSGVPRSAERDSHYDEFLTKLLLDHENVVVTVAGEVFNHRMKSLYEIFDSYKVR